MPTASVTGPKATQSREARTIAKSLNTSTQSRFATSNLIKNLGSSNDGMKFTFSKNLRTVYGRD